MINRSLTGQSWEITQVNELLTSMENFKGILLSSTNLKGRVDSAAMRRFCLKLEFDYLDNSGKIIFFDRVLGDLIKESMSKNEESKLMEIQNLTPGDFKVLRQRFVFLKQSIKNNEQIINALAEEVSKKNNVKLGKLGF